MSSLSARFPSQPWSQALGAVVLSLAAGLPAAQAADISLSFDQNAQGVTEANGGTLTYNPAGYLVQQDINSDDMVVVLPTSLLGDWSAFLDGTLSFDAINLSGVVSDWDPFGLVTITGASGTVSFDIVPGAKPTTTWATYSGTLSTANFGASLPAVLANVTGVTIKLESHQGYDTNPMLSDYNGFDNLKVSAVPEPASVAMMLAGLACVGVASRRSSWRRPAHQG
jgi:Flp pilus assembly protein TadG